MGRKEYNQTNKNRWIEYDNFQKMTKNVLNAEQDVFMRL